MRRIRKRFRSQGTLRAGTEWRFGNWYYRGGWAFTSDAFALNDRKSTGRQGLQLALAIGAGMSRLTSPRTTSRKD